MYHEVSCTAHMSNLSILHDSFTCTQYVNHIPAFKWILVQWESNSNWMYHIFTGLVDLRPNNHKSKLPNKRWALIYSYCTYSLLAFAYVHQPIKRRYSHCLKCVETDQCKTKFQSTTWNSFYFFKFYFIFNIFIIFFL